MQYKYNEPIFGYKKKKTAWGFQFENCFDIILIINLLRKMYGYNALFMKNVYTL